MDDPSDKTLVLFFPSLLLSKASKRTERNLLGLACTEDIQGIRIIQNIEG